jgi:hypothetical protein
MWSHAQAQAQAPSEYGSDVPGIALRLRVMRAKFCSGAAEQLQVQLVEVSFFAVG